MNENNNPVLPLPDDIDWDALMRDISPPEWDLLLSAAAKNDLDHVRTLVEQEQVPVSHSNGIGQTALHVAAMWGHDAVVRYLVQKGAKVDVANQLTGATPLHALLQSHKTAPEKQATLVEYLVFEGKADPLIEDKFGKVPLEYITRQKSTHPVFCQAKYAALLPKLTPKPPGVDRLRTGFMRQIMTDIPVCSTIPKK